MIEQQIAVHSRPYRTQNCGNPRAFMQEPGNVLRFESRPGDLVGGNERTEIYGVDLYHKSVTVEFDFCLEPGAALGPDWCLIGQFQRKTDPISPPIALELKGETLRIVGRDKPGAYIWANQKQTPRIERGRWYWLKLKAEFGEAGSLNAWLDNKPIAAYSGLLNWPDPKGGYWKSGIYRAPAGDTLVVRQRNLLVTA